MSKCFSRPRATIEYQYYEENSSLETRTIHEEINEATDTGLLDINGNSLYRQNTKQPIGFKLK